MLVAVDRNIRKQMHHLFQISDHQLRKDARRASILNLAARGTDFLFQFIGMAILARLVTPDDFGVFAMATPFVWVFMTLGDLGLASAILQQRDLNEGQASAVFHINLLAGFACGLIFLASSPLLGYFYADTRVTKVAAALSLMFFLFSVTAVQQALLRRALLFEALLRAQVASSLTSSTVAILSAINGAGYWALVIRALVDPLVYTTVLWISSGWLPGRTQWDQITRALLRFGRYSVGSSIVYSCGRNAINVLIGWRYGSAELGPFALANRLFILPAQQISWPLGHVMVPALSRLRDDPDRLKRWYLKLLRLMTFVSLPPLFSLAICADDVVYVLTGPQWHQAVDILRLLGPIAALQVGYATTDWLMRSHGQADRILRWTAIDAATNIIGCIVGLPWGAFGVAAGLAAASVVLFLPGFIYAGTDKGIRLADVLQAMAPCWVLAMLVLAAVWALRMSVPPEWHPFARLLATGAVISGVMACASVVLYGRSLLGRAFLAAD